MSDLKKPARPLSERNDFEVCQLLQKQLDKLPSRRAVRITEMLHSVQIGRRDELALLPNTGKVSNAAFTEQLGGL